MVFSGRPCATHGGRLAGLLRPYQARRCWFAAVALWKCTELRSFNMRKIAFVGSLLVSFCTAGWLRQGLILLQMNWGVRAALGYPFRLSVCVLGPGVFHCRRRRAAHQLFEGADWDGSAAL